MRRGWLAATPLLALFALPACDTEPNTAATGVYNVRDTNDNTNLELREDGTFRTLTIGCDYEGSSSGLWSMDGDVVVLRAEGDGEQNWREGVCPSACFGWSYVGPEGAGLTAAVEEVRLEPQGGGRLFDSHSPS